MRQALVSGLVLSVLALLFGTMALLASAPITIHVTDGDTIRLNGQLCRLMDFDAPETKRAKCTKERLLGLEAKRRVEEMLKEGATAKLVGPDCKHDRKCCRVTLNGEDVGDILMREGLAVPYPGGRGPKHDWCK
jgi:micrococcal nuclease